MQTATPWLTERHGYDPTLQGVEPWSGTGNSKAFYMLSNSLVFEVELESCIPFCPYPLYFANVTGLNTSYSGLMMHPLTEHVPDRPFERRLVPPPSEKMKFNLLYSIKQQERNLIRHLKLWKSSFEG